MRFEDFLSRLEGVTGGPQQYRALCPSHDDHDASLSVAQDGDGKILVFCHASCTYEDIVAAMGLQPKHLFPGHEPPIDLVDLATAKQLPVEFVAHYVRAPAHADQ